ncbi:MAG: CDP-glycerol--glycerophosphate glycerophosphotransferase [Burkholderiales bacterium]|nr:CDP-glycerol--glycerophosphate glycerophosphotransferase [Burkholderiales bacterium]
MRDGLRHLSRYVAFLRLAAARRRIVVYTEGAASWPHLGPVVMELLRRGQPVSYVSSSPTDPGLAVQHPSLSSFVIGDGHVRTLFFSTLETELLLMTMPDLNSFHIKRSQATRLYVYLHHSLVSCHMIYREGAFDHFDAVLCSGPHHVAELQALEVQRGTRAKQLLPHGYGRLDALLEAARRPGAAARPRQVLVAPSWGPEGLLERHADSLIGPLAASGWEVVVRPHPQTVRLAPQAMERVRHWCRSSANVRLDEDVAGQGSLLASAVMVSDWSGAALEFALGLERPVLFVDTPRKVNNPSYADIALEPVEVGLRASLGAVIGLAELGDIGVVLDRVSAQPAEFALRMQALRNKTVFHAGNSAAAAADYIDQQLRGG